VENIKKSCPADASKLAKHGDRDASVLVGDESFDLTLEFSLA
jgi:hypothetical protein